METNKDTFNVDLTNMWSTTNLLGTTPLTKEMGIEKKLLQYSLSDLISLHGWIDSEADLIEALGGDNTARLEEAREQMTTIHKEIERRRNNLFNSKHEEKKLD